MSNVYEIRIRKTLDDTAPIFAFYLTEPKLKELLESEVPTNAVVDTKTGESYSIQMGALNTLNIEP